MAKKKRKINKVRVSEDFWFRKRTEDLKNSWGFIPINWKGWVTLVLLIGVNIFAANYFDVMNVGFGEVSKFLVVFLLSIFIFIIIARRKTSGTKN